MINPICRAKRLDNNEWVYGYYWKEDNNCNWNDEHKETHHIRHQNNLDWGLYEQIDYKVDPSTICIFTGLKDKYGKDIYEGDILDGDTYPLLSLDKTERNYCIEIYWSEINLSFSYQIHKKPGAAVNGISDGSCEGIYQTRFDEKYWIIGNVFDNPELIGERDE